jgi:dienelactone hydrolase
MTGAAVPDPPVRGIHGAAVVPGFDAPFATVHWRADVPAAPASSADPRTGLIGPHPDALPLPVCIIHPNFSCGPELYRWLARDLALSGWCAVTFTWVVPGIDGTPMLSTGLSLSTFTNAVLDPILAALPFPIDRRRIAAFGHSAGGTCALVTPGLRAAISYGGHVLVPGGGALEMEPGPARLVIAGTHDGIVGTLTGTQGSALDKLRTTAEAAPPVAELAVIDGADHYAICAGYDASTGRGHLEAPGPTPAVSVRARVRMLVLDWLAAHAA